MGETSDEWLHRSKFDPTWPHVLWETARRLADSRDGEEIAWEAIHESFKRFASVGIPVDDSHLAAIAYCAGNFSEAVENWDRGGQTTDERYYRAKAKVVSFPDSLIYLNELSDHGEILRIWYDETKNMGRSQVEAIDARVIRAAADAALAMGDRALAVKMMEIHTDLGGVGKLLEAGAAKNDYDTMRAGAILGARFFVQTGDWSAAVEAATSADFSKLRLKKGYYRQDPFGAGGRGWTRRGPDCRRQRTCGVEASVRRISWSARTDCGFSSALFL